MPKFLKILALPTGIRAYLNSPDNSATFRKARAQSARGDIDHLKIIGGKGISRQQSLIPLGVANFRAAENLEARQLAEESLIVRAAKRYNRLHASLRFLPNRSIVFLTLRGGASERRGTRQSKPTPQVVTQDTVVTSLAGPTFTLPAGWSMTTEVSSNTLQPPEPDTCLVLLEERAPDAATAVANAWKSYRPNWNRPLKVAMDLTPREGWSARKQFIYETSPNEKAVVVAVALRAGDIWTVLLAGGTEPTFDKQRAQVSLIVESLCKLGYNRESFAGRKALPITP